MKGFVFAFAAAAAGVAAAAAPLAAEASTTVASLNWAGYVITGSTYGDVQANWTQPSVSCSSSRFEASAYWVGMGGVNAPELEQIGTEADCSGGQPVYSTWFEMFPSPVQRLSLPVQPGDRVSADVAFKNGEYTLSLTTTSGGSFTTSFTTAGDNTSAEFVVEAPATCNPSSGKCTPQPLANFGTVSFDGASATPADAPTFKVVMVTKHGTPKAVPSDFIGGQFSVAWLHS
jgi:hypothetical protein